MKIEMGVWIDHRQAVIVTLFGEREEIGRIRSNIGKHLSYSSTLTDEAAAEVDEDQPREKYLNRRKQGYYAAVLRRLSPADSIMIFGPNEIKNELQERLLHYERSGRIVGIQTTDKVSVREFAAKVREQFNALNQSQA